MRVLVAGDTHGDTEWARSLTKVAGKRGASTVIQVGDFGYWPRMKTSSRRSHAEAFLGTISRSCEAFGVAEWIVLDGNHDDHDGLAERCAYGLDDEGFASLWSHVRYAPRGHRFELGGARFGTLGGAVSLDAWIEQTGFDFGTGRRYRVGWDWFPDREAPKLSDVEHLGTDPVDVLLAHEAPSAVDMSRFEGFRGIDIPVEALGKTAGARELVTLAATNTGCRVLIHGHWHSRLTTLAEFAGKACVVEGLASNSFNGGRDGRAYLFLDIGARSENGCIELNVTDGRHADTLPIV